MQIFLEIKMLYSRFREPMFKYLSLVGSKRFCSSNSSDKFETVFTLPSIKYIALLNRLKVYHLFGTCIILPGCGALEMANIVPELTALSAAYVGLTGAAVLTLASVPFRNIIGFLYISENNKFIKISSVDFWGRRIDRIIQTDDWIPLLDVPSKKTDILYLSPELTDGSKYKLLVKFGNILNSKKMGEVLE